MSRSLPTYERAARDLRARDEPITISTLADEIGIRDCAVHKYLKRHPEIREKLGVLTHADMLATEYIAAAALIRAADKKVTIGNLSRQTTWPSTRISAYMRMHPELAESLGLPKRVDARSEEEIDA